jgi:hypothetical protein
VLLKLENGFLFFLSSSASKWLRSPVAVRTNTNWQHTETLINTT